MRKEFWKWPGKFPILVHRVQWVPFGIPDEASKEFKRGELKKGDWALGSYFWAWASQNSKQGSFGVVWLARNRNTGYLYAVKNMKARADASSAVAQNKRAHAFLLCVPEKRWVVARASQWRVWTPGCRRSPLVFWIFCQVEARTVEGCQQWLLAKRLG